MNDSFGGGFNTTGGESTPFESKPEGVVPVYIKQILDSADDNQKANFQMFGFSFGIVTCVAIVRNIDHSSTKITYRLEDHTGQLDAHYWLEEGDSIKVPTIVPNSYVRVFGTMKSNNGTKIIMIFKIEPIESINELSTHLLEVLFCRFKSEEFSKKSTEFGGDFTSGVSAVKSTNDSNLGVTGGFNPKQLAIYQAIKSHAASGGEGMSVQGLEKKFNHISSSELRAIMDFMSSEGHVYTSIDSDHFLPTEM